MTNIGGAARASGVSIKMIRYYESIGLIGPVARTAAGYRVYGDDDVRTLRFVRHARTLGFAMPKIAALLALWRDRGRDNAAVRRLAEGHLADLQEQIAALEGVRSALHHLVGSCARGRRAHCPILATLADEIPQAHGEGGERRTPAPRARSIVRPRAGA